MRTSFWRITFLIAILPIVLIGCKKNAELTSETSITTTEEVQERRQSSQIYEFYFDRIQVNEGTFEIDDETLYVTITGEPTSNPEVTLIKVLAFTTEGGYLEWATSLGLPAARNLEIEKHLSHYADSSGVEAIFEQTGEIPKWYTDYEYDYLEEMGVVNFNEVTPRSLCTLRKGCFSGSSTVMVHSIPGFSPFFGWNNSVTSFLNFTIFGNVKIYDNSFYRKRLIDFWGFGVNPNNTVCFTGPLAPINNKMSSGLSF